MDTTNSAHSKSESLGRSSWQLRRSAVYDIRTVSYDSSLPTSSGGAEGGRGRRRKRTGHNPPPQVAKRGRRWKRDDGDNSAFDSLCASYLSAKMPSATGTDSGQQSEPVYVPDSPPPPPPPPLFLPLSPSLPPPPDVPPVICCSPTNSSSSSSSSSDLIAVQLTSRLPGDSGRQPFIPSLMSLPPHPATNTPPIISLPHLSPLPLLPSPTPLSTIFPLFPLPPLLPLPHCHQ